MYKNNYQHYSLTKKQTTKQTFTIGQFLGVNYNKNSLAIKDSQATEMKNLIFRDGVIQKRQGYENVCSIVNQTLNGVYKFLGDDNNEHLIFHIGKNLYEAIGLGKGSKYSEVSFSKISYTNDDNETEYYEINNHQSFGVPSNHKLYLLDGEKYRVLSCDKDGVFALKNVEDDENTFIPTTTIGITEKYSGISQRTGLDDVNMLTSMRINKIVTGIERPNNEDITQETYEYELDGAICDKDNVSISDMLSKIEITAYMYPQAQSNES